MIQKRFYNIEELATILGKSVAAIHGYLSRRRFDAVPQPIKLGRRLAWLVESVDEWIAGRAAQAAAEAQEHRKFMQAPAKRRGRPTKAETKTKKHAVSTYVK